MRARTSPPPHSNPPLTQPLAQPCNPIHSCQIAHVSTTLNQANDPLQNLPEIVAFRASGKLVTIKISHCYKVYRKGCNSYKQCVVSILLQHVSVVTILLQHIILVTMRIGCNNVKIKYLLLQRLINVVTQIFVATMNGICCKWQILN